MLRVAVIGAGSWGRNHVRVVASEPGCALAAVVDPDPAARARAQELVPGVPTTADSDQIFGDPTIDAVVISSPAITHAALARHALASGKHVLVEKPLAMSLADACTVRSTAKQAGKIAMVGHLMVHHPAVAR